MVTTRSSSSSSPTPSAAAAGNSLAIDPVSKARTIAHMNKEHAADLAAILRHHHRQHREQLGEEEGVVGDEAELLDLDLAALTIRAGAAGNHRVHTVALDPPMASWADRRARLIAMTLAAREALGLPISTEEQQHAASSSSSSGPVGIKWYPPERASDWVPFVIVLADYLAALLVWAGQLRPGTPLHRLLLSSSAIVPRPETLAWVATRAFPCFVGCHLLEMVWFDRTRLRPAGVRRGSKVWCQWLGCQLVDGFATFQRWDRRVVAAAGGKKKGGKEL